MARTTDTLVKGIIDVDSTISLAPFIDLANQLVTELCTNSGYASARLTTIETWLSAHFYALFDQQVASEKAGKVSVNYQYQIGLVFMQTKYGQSAMVADTAGNLAQLSKQIEDGESASVSLTWLGTDYDTEDDED